MMRIREMTAIAGLGLLWSCGGAQSGEGGAGLYIPGSYGFGAGATPPPGLYLSHANLYYDGKIARTVEGGRVDVNARKIAAPFAANLLWVLPDKVWGGNLGFSVTMPYASFTRLTASSGALGRSAAVEGWGLGDATFKAQIGWTHGSFAHTLSGQVWAPTGRYDTGFEPNAGKNHVGFNLAWGFTQKWAGPGIELSASTGITSELRNQATRYRNGTTLNLDAALGKYFSNGLTLGVAAYAFKQIARDSGSGATLGSFRGQAFGVGPALSYSFLVDKRPVSIALRHYQEFAVENRFKGHMSSLTVTTRF